MGWCSAFMHLHVIILSNNNNFKMQGEKMLIPIVCFYWAYTRYLWLTQAHLSWPVFLCKSVNAMTNWHLPWKSSRCKSSQRPWPSRFKLCHTSGLHLASHSFCHITPSISRRLENHGEGKYKHLCCTLRAMEGKPGDAGSLHSGPPRSKPDVSRKSVDCCYREVLKLYCSCSSLR